MAYFPETFPESASCYTMINYWCAWTGEQETHARVCTWALKHALSLVQCSLDEIDMHSMAVTLMGFFAVRICQSRPGAPGFTELRPRSLGRHQVSFWPVLSAHPGTNWQEQMQKRLQINPSWWLLKPLYYFSLWKAHTCALQNTPQVKYYGMQNSPCECSLVFILKL